MKKKTILMACAALLALSSCQKATFLTSDEKKIVADLQKSQGSITFHSDADNFSIEHAPEWVTAEMLDSTLVYYVPENPTTSERTDSIVVTCGGMTLTLPVTQIYKVTKLEVDKPAIQFTIDGGTETVNVTTDGSKVKIDAPKFVQTTYKDGVLTITTGKNDGSSLSDTIRLASGELTTLLPVVVEGNFCGTCKGAKKIDCPQCKGEGITERRGAYYGCSRCGGIDDFPLETHGQIVSCSGMGKITCPTCHGTGK